MHIDLWEKSIMHYTRSDILRQALNEVPGNLGDELHDGRLVPFEDMFKYTSVWLEEGDTAWYPTPLKLRPETVFQGPGWACYYLRADEELGVLGTGEYAPHLNERAELRDDFGCGHNEHHEEVCQRGAILAEARVGISEIYLVETVGEGFMVFAFHLNGISEHHHHGDLQEMTSWFQRYNIEAFDAARNYGYDKETD